MGLLILGLALWASIHFFPGLAPTVRARLLDRLGDVYRGLISLGMLVALALIIFGWRGVLPVPVYEAPAWGAAATSILMVPALFLFLAPYGKLAIRRYLRHPQLTGVVLWGLGHLLSSGDDRALVLFGAMALWAVCEMVIINRRDGPWQKPEGTSWRADGIWLAVTVALYALLVFAHPYMAGIPV